MQKQKLSKEVEKFRERYEDFIGIKKGEHIFKIHSDYFDSIAPFWLEELKSTRETTIKEVLEKVKENGNLLCDIETGLVSWGEIKEFINSLLKE